MSIVLRPQHEKMPDEVLARAWNFGKQVSNSIRANKDQVISDIGLYLLRAKYHQYLTAVEIIDLNSSGVIFHPRSGVIENIPYTIYDANTGQPTTQYTAGVAGGWKNGNEVLTTKYVFPLVDDDNASFLISKESANETGEFPAPDDKYGNLYWIGNTDDLDILSWRGTPTRHFRLPNNYDIPGFSSFETSIKGAIEDTPEYTAFGYQLYYRGSTFAETPKYSWPYNDTGVNGSCLLLGAMRNNVSSDIYIVTQSDHYNAPSLIYVFSDNGRSYSESEKQLYLTQHPGTSVVFNTELSSPGFYLGLWKYGGVIDGWELIKEQSYTRNELPWFGNLDGTEFVCSNGDKIDIDGKLILNVNTVGEYKESGDIVGSMSFSANYSGTQYSEFKDNILISSLVNLTFNASSSILSTPSVYLPNSGLFSVYTVSPPQPLILSGPEDYAVGAYTATGGDGTYTWFYPTDNCGMGTIAVVDSCGNSASMTVRMPVGNWVRHAELDYGDGIGPVTDYVTCISGNRKTFFNMRTTTNLIFGAGLQWNAIQNKCLAGTVPLYDGGLPAGKFGPTCGPLYKSMNTYATDAGNCYPAVDFASWYVVSSALVYLWEC